VVTDITVRFLDASDAKAAAVVRVDRQDSRPVAQRGRQHFQDSLALEDEPAIVIAKAKAKFERRARVAAVAIAAAGIEIDAIARDDLEVCVVAGRQIASLPTDSSGQEARGEQDERGDGFCQHDGWGKGVLEGFCESSERVGNDCLE